ncbi:MAG: YfhL family 4Fe-4S dicluster ferredoxin [Thermodesulfobacteriota bacterium]
MALKITEDCVACDVCRPECPVDAISEGEDIYSIDPKVCVECKGYFDAPKCAEVCPTDACVPEGEE